MSGSDAAIRFLSLEMRLRSEMTPESVALLEKIAAMAPRRANCRRFESLGAEVELALKQVGGSEDERRDFSRALIARLAQRTMKRAAALALTPKVIRRANQWLLRLAEFLEAKLSGLYAYPEDWFCKDYRFVTMMTVPCGAQVVDLEARIGPKTALILAMGNPVLGVRAAASSWFRVHTEGRYLDEFNDAGWQDCYRELVELMYLNPHISGMVATSWFYDPVLAEISPRLAYLRTLPIANGAVSVRHGTTAFDIHSATATSPSRRALHEAGQYTPKSYSIFWQRNDMEAWAKEASSLR